MAVEGTLDLFQLPEILQVVSQQRKTGILTVQGPADIVAVSFLEGRIVAADSLTETTEEGIGEVLVAEGKVDATLLRGLSHRSSQGGPRLGDLLVSGGHIDRGELLEALRSHTVKLLESLLDWRTGQFKFYGGDEVSYEEGFRSIGVDELLLRAIEDQERDALPEPDSLLDRTTSERSVRVRELDDLAEPEPIGEMLDGLGDALWLTPEEARVLEEVAAHRPVYEVAQAARVPLDRTRYILFRLAREGLVVRAEPAAESLSPPTGAPPVTATDPLSDLTLDEPIQVAPAPGTLHEMAPGPAAGAPGAEIEDTTERRPRPPRERPRQPPREAVLAETGRSLPITGLLAVILAAVVLGAVVLTPSGVVLPFPWLTRERTAQSSVYDAVLLSKIDRAAQTYFLLKGRFPDRLQDLVGLGLLQREDLVDARGRTLSYGAAEGSFQIHPVTVEGAEEEPPGARRSISGNFLLDPEFLAPIRGGTDEPPLVLLD